MNRECGCGRPTDLYGCRVCADDLAVLLGDVPALVMELDTTLARLGRTVVGGGKSRETPLPFHPQAAEVQAHLRSVVGTWAAHIGVHSGDLEPKKTAQSWKGRAVIPVTPPTDVASLGARWLLKNLKAIRMNERFAEIHDDVNRAVKDARRTIDRPADRAYAGPCDGTGSVTVQLDVDPCGYDLLASPEWETVRCRVCGHEYYIALRRQAMLDDLRDRLYPATAAARIVTALGVKVAASTVRVWAHRGKLYPRDWTPPAVKTDGQPVPLYRIADIVAVAAGLPVDYEEAS